MCNLQHVQFATRVICNICNLQHTQFELCAFCNMCKTNRLDGSARQISWMNQLDGPAGRTSKTDLEAIACSHIQRLTFQCVHCRSFCIGQSSCLLLYTTLDIASFNITSLKIDLVEINLQKSLQLKLSQ